DFEARDVLTPAADAVAQAIDEVVPALVVVFDCVTGVEPTVAPRFDRLLRVVVVADVQRPRLARAHNELADDIGPDRFVEGIDGADLMPGVAVTRSTARRPRPMIPRCRERAANFGLTVGRAHAHAEATLEVQHFRDHRADYDRLQWIVGVVGPRWRGVEQR